MDLEPAETKDVEMLDPRLASLAGVKCGPASSPPAPPLGSIGSDEDSDDDPDEIKFEKGAFRFSAKNLLLTYAQCELGANWIMGHIRQVCDEKDWKVTKVVWCDELHKDGSGHSHIAINFTKRPNIKDVTVFDVEGHHPNWAPGKGKGAWNKIMHYVQKTGRWEGTIDFPKTPQNYTKNKRDYEEWQRDAKMNNPVKAYPIKLPDGSKIEEPKGPTRQSIYLIVGVPEVGKSFFKDMGLQVESFYDVPAEQQYRFEGYAGEPIIVYDDVIPIETDLIKLCQWTRNKVIVPGATRYNRVYLKPEQQRIIIVICNYEHIPECFQSERIVSRTARVIEWNAPFWADYDAIWKKLKLEFT